MKKIIYSLFLAIVFTPYLGQTQTAFHELKVFSAFSDLEIGVSRVNITGEEAVVLDTLNVKAMVFKQGKTMVAIAVCDVVGMPVDVYNDARTRVAKATGIPYENICVAASHTHMDSPHKELAPAVLKAVIVAMKKIKPVELTWGIGREPNISHNRRYYMKDGSVRFNPMFLNPDIIRPVGPIDADVNFVLITDKGTDKPFASMSNFAAHLDCVKEYGAVYQKDGAGSRNSVSADYPYWLEESLREKYGNKFQSVFFSGCSGNINHWDFSKPGPQSGHKTHAKMMGDSLYSAINRVLPQLVKEKADLQIRSQVVNVPLLEISSEQLEWAKSLNNNRLSGKSEEMDERKMFLDRVNKGKIEWIHEQNKKGMTTYPFDVQVIKLTKNTAIVTLPGEIFIEYQLAIKNFSPFENTMFIELANSGAASYVPNRKAYKEGGYEVAQAVLKPGGGEMLAEAAINMLKDLKK